ncbi:GNAT family N-acetyltransferase [Amphibacillus sp. Q70]|uniref:GNAT family N-acetyltransferase n=1 Tax=Amphibacillus sp. Q70 TaxID=3453416 RepID=UPI003F82CA6E
MSDSIRLVEINDNNWNHFTSMYPGDEGANYIASNSYSLVQAYFEKTWLVKGISSDSIPIGFTMYGLDKKTNRYELCRLMIDYKFQEQGFGQKVLPIIIDEMFNNWNPEKIYLSTNPKNTRAIKLYEKLGFVKTDEMVDGEVLFYLAK